MKNILKFTLILCFITGNFGCKNEAKTEGEPSAQEEPQQEETKAPEEQVFVVKMDVIIKNDDKFQMLFVESGQEKWNTEAIISARVTGQESPQTIEFRLPEGVWPAQLRIDMGEKKTKEEISLISVDFTFEDFSLSLNPEEFYTYFTPNPYISYTKESGLMVCSEIDGKYDPFFRSRPVFNSLLEVEAR